MIFIVFLKMPFPSSKRRRCSKVPAVLKGEQKRVDMMGLQGCLALDLGQGGHGWYSRPFKKYSQVL